MPNEWDLGEFAALVKGKIGEPHQRAMFPALESIPEKFRYCHYHTSRALELMAPHKGDIKDPLAQSAAAMQMLFGTTEEDRRKFGEALFGARAHSVAFAQSLHATADYLAKVLYRGLNLAGLHGITLSDTAIGLARVRDRIATIPELAPVAQKISDYLSSDAFRYLAGFVNTEKHHEIVDATFSLSFSVGSVASAGLKMKTFQYSGTSFPEKWAADFFEKDFQAIIERTAEVGVATNTYLKTLP